LGRKQKIEKVIIRDGQEIRVEQEVKKDWHSVEGFREGWIRKKINKDFPICPFCKTTQPNWEWRNIHEKIKGGLISKAKGTSKLYGIDILPVRAKRIHFRCMNCEAIISILRYKQSRVWRIESAGKNENIQHLINEEYLDEVLHEWAKTDASTTRPRVAKARDKGPEEKIATQSVTCPHCGLEIKKEAQFCPQCGQGLADVSKCPECKKIVEKGERYCSNCGKDLSGTKPTSQPAASVAGTPPPKPNRPTGITIMCILWLLGGLYNFFNGLYGFGTDLDILISWSQGYHYADPAVNAWASWAIPTETILMFIGLVLGIMQFATIYGFWNRKDWSYRTGITVPIVTVIVSWLHMFLILGAPQLLDPTPNYVLPFTNIGFALVYIAYLRQVHVKKWLRVSVVESPIQNA